MLRTSQNASRNRKRCRYGGLGHRFLVLLAFWDVLGADVDKSTSAILSNSHKCSFNDRIKNASLCEKYLHTNIFLQRWKHFFQARRRSQILLTSKSLAWNMHNDFFRSVSSKTSSHRAVFRESCYNMIAMRKSRVMLYITLWKEQIIWFYMICCDSRI